MERVIVIRFGELFLKGKNRDYFESMLVRNIKWALEGVDCVFERSQGRYFVENYNMNHPLLGKGHFVVRIILLH